jgi:benzylsuccinate CoA-transferase BbsF subunit
VKRLLSDVKVLDFSWMIAGPFATKFFSDHGATVVKIETMKRQDVMRHFQPYRNNKPGTNRSGVWAAMNSGKYSMALNLGSPKGREVAMKLAAWADVVIENYAPGTMQEWGFTYDDFKKVNDDIIMISMSSLGQTGPFARYHGLGFHLQGFAGFNQITGFPGREPFGSIAYTDFTAPPFAVTAVLGALDYRRRTGKGLYMDNSQVEASMHFLGPTLLEGTVNGRDTMRNGNYSTYAAPHNAYKCKGNDRWCAIAVFTDAQWNSLRQAMGDPAWSKDEKFSTLLGRLEHVKELDVHVETWTSQRSPEQIMQMLQALGVPAGVVNDGRRLVEDPNFAARGFFQTFDHSEIGEAVTRRSPITYSNADSSVPRGAPVLGQDTEFVCTKILNMSDEEWLGLMESGILA